MATRSTIGLKSEDGTVKAIYCHWDGYAEGGVGSGLIDNYNSREQAEELIAIGGFSSLRETLEETKAEAYNTESEKARTFDSVTDWVTNFNCGEEYYHLYTDEKGWEYANNYGDKIIFSQLKTEEKVGA